MNAVGRVGNFFAQSVYTVSGPFHPFGGAVDIIVVQQEDGTFKSSPWYVKFGKFQGVLKRTEKKVVVAVNDSDANFHMYLDHKGEAYFLKDPPGEDGTLALSPTEAASSGDESSNPTMALEYNKGDEGVDARTENGKEESEDERGDDLELRFEGREASKQLIQQSVEERTTAALLLEQREPGTVNFSSDLQVLESLDSLGSPDERPGGDIPEISVGTSENDHKYKSNEEEICVGTPESDNTDCNSNREVSSPLLNEASGHLARKSSPTSALVAQAVLASFNSSSYTGNATLKDALSKEQENESNNGMIIHGLLNQAIGLQPSQVSGLGSALVANAALDSLHRIVSNDNSRSTPQTQSRILELPEDLSELENTLYAVPGNLSDELDGKLKDEVSSLVSIFSPNIVDSIKKYDGRPPCDVMLPVLFSKSGNLLRELQIGNDEPVLEDCPSESCTDQIADVTKILEVTKMDYVGGDVVVEVLEHNEKETSLSNPTELESVGSYTNGRVEHILIDQNQILDEVLDLQRGVRDVVGGEALNAESPGVHEECKGPQEAGHQNVRVNVDKHLVENLNDAMLQSNLESPRVILTDKIDVAAFGNEEQIGPEKTTDGILEVTTGGKEIQGKEGNEGKEDKESKGGKEGNGSKELTVLSGGNLGDVGSPRLKAAIELEVAWRDVMEKAAATLKVAPYASKSLHSKQSGKTKDPSTSEDVQKKLDGQDGMLPEQSEKKTWGVWFWGASSAPPPKPSSQQGNLKDPRTGQGEMNTELRTSELAGKHELGNQSAAVLDQDHDEVVIGGSDSKAQRREKGVQFVSDLGLDDHVEFVSESNVQQKHLDVPLPPRRRSIFGLLSRASSNQPASSTASTLQSNYDMQPIADYLKRETSLERAEIVVDLLDVRWARGSDASIGLMPIASIQHEKIIAKETFSERSSDGNTDGQSMGAVPQQLDAKAPAVVDLEDGEDNQGLMDEQKLSLYGLGSKEADTVVRQLISDRAENSSPLNDCVEVGHDVVKAEDTGNIEPDIEFATNGSEQEHSSTNNVLYHGQGEFISSQNTQVVLMSVDGHVITAPIVSVEDEHLQDYHGLDKVVFGDKNPSDDRLQQAVCLADVSVGISVPGSNANDLQQIGKQETHCTKGVRLPNDTMKESNNCLLDDSVGDIEPSLRFKGLNALGKLQIVNNIEVSNPMVDTSPFPGTEMLASGWKGNEPEPTSDLEIALEKETNGTGRDIIGTADSEAFKNMQAIVLERPEDEDSADLEQDGMERFYSSKDLTEMEEMGTRKVFRRTTSVYLDAISGVDDQESDGSGHENDLDRTRDGSSPVVIPGTLERVRSFHSVDDIHLLRTCSESLPNARHCVINSEMLSPRLQLSRSLDSAPLPILMPADTRHHSSASGDTMATPGPSDITMFTGFERVRDNASEAERELKMEGKLCINRTTSTLSGTSNNREKGPETGFELSLCRQLLTEKMGLEAAAAAFASAKVTVEDFKISGPAIAANENLVVKVGGRYYPWVVAAPIVLGILAFGQVLVAPNEGAIPVEKAVVVIDENATTHALTTVTSSGWFWPFGRTSKTPDRGVAAVMMSRDALNIATEAALKSKLTKEYLRMNGYYKRPRKVRTNSPSSQQLESLNLKDGSNNITFTFETRMLGKQQVHARIFLWKWDTRIVISDVDGTITKSDVLGQFMPLVGKDWTQSGVARLFTSIKKNGYELLFLSARAISQSHITRQFLENIKQDGEGLPDGPVVISPDGLFPSLYREVIRRAPHEFKIACLEDIKSLFPPETKPFYAGFGNRDTDELSYLKVGISKGKIFIINPKGEVVVNNQVDVKSYTSLHKLVDDMFPAMTFTEQEDYNEWNFWKLPLPDVEDQPSLQSLSSSTSKRSGKSGRHS